MGGICGTAQIESIVFTHYFHLFQGFDLFCHLFAQADTGVSHRSGEVAQIFFFSFNQSVDTVESHTAVVTDDTSASVVVGQSGEESQRTERTDFFGIYVEHSIVVCLAVVGEDIFHTVVHFHAVFVASLAYYVDTSERLDSTFQKLVCLQTDD